MRSPEQIPIQSDWCPSKEKGLVHRHRQKVVQHSEDASSTRQGQGLRRNQPGRHPGLRLPASNCERISRCCLSCSCVVPCLAGLGTNARAVACASSSAFFSPCGKHVWTAKSPTRQGDSQGESSSHLLFSLKNREDSVVSTWTLEPFRSRNPHILKYTMLLIIVLDPPGFSCLLCVPLWFLVSGGSTVYPQQ